MKNAILKYGGYSFLIAMILFSISLLLGRAFSYSTHQLIGFLAIVTALILAIYYSVKDLRESYFKTEFGFGKAFAISLLISFFVGFGVALTHFIYTSVINPDFMTEYLANHEEILKETLSEEEFLIKREELSKMPEYQKSSWYIAFMMYFVSVFWGFFVSLAMAMILKRKK